MSGIALVTLRQISGRRKNIFFKIMLKTNHLAFLCIITHNSVRNPDAGMGDYIHDMVKDFSKKEDDGTIETERFLKLLNKWHKKSPEELSIELNLSNERDPLILQFLTP